ncbi:DUF7336 domain-containing protein [Sessilibacter corallicola]|uniref:DUF7336 domain-containing protein n=1 Tax=Sessilibacter corallicola TaxID=2904075 RepID=A0ABQ0AER3_9GAMM
MRKIYLLWHVHEQENRDDEKLIGAYASESDAKAAIDRLKEKPGFRYQPEGFQICPYTLGEDHWTEGYSTMTAIYVRNVGASGQRYICVSAAIHPGEVYEICGTSNSLDEKWEFSSGEFVKCIEFQSEPGVTDLLASEKIDPNF